MGRIENPNLKNDYERACGWYGHFNKSEMALFSECTDTVFANRRSHLALYSAPPPP